MHNLTEHEQRISMLESEMERVLRRLDALDKLNCPQPKTTICKDGLPLDCYDYSRSIPCPEVF